MQKSDGVCPTPADQQDEAVETIIKKIWTIIETEHGFSDPMLGQMVNQPSDPEIIHMEESPLT